MDTALQFNTLWVLICTALVFFMQAGFCCLESGLSRSKNSINVAIKNVVDLCVAAGPGTSCTGIGKASALKRVAGNNLGPAAWHDGA